MYMHLWGSSVVPWQWLITVLIGHSIHDHWMPVAGANGHGSYVMRPLIVSLGRPSLRSWLAWFGGQHGSSIDLSLRINDTLELEVDPAAGTSVAHGNQIDLDWWFEDQEMKFSDVSNLKRFIEQFADW